MKMYLGNTPIKSLNIKHYEMNTNSATMITSDLQAGVTAFAKGKKVTGTGKSFEFANYGFVYTNFPILVSSMINIIEISSVTYPVKLAVALSDMARTDFSGNLNIGSVFIENTEYPISLVITDNILQLNCEKDVRLEIFYGKDNYV